MQQLPGGPDEGPSIDNLRQQASGHDIMVKELESKLALRPKPSQYDALGAEIVRFVNNTADVQRMKNLILHLKVACLMLCPLHASLSSLQ